MTLGKKIGGGFTLLIILTLILGVMAYKAMDDSSDTSEQIASDRVPRMVDYSLLQSDLQQAAYWSRSYFSLQDEAMFDRFLGYLKEMREDLAKLVELNKRYHFEATANFLDDFSKNVDRYEALNKTDRQSLLAMEKANNEMFAAGTKAQGDLEILLATLTATQAEFVNKGDNRSALQYGRNIATVTSTLARVADVFAQLLLAERKRDVEGFEKIRELLPSISNDFRGLERFLLREECKEIYADTMGAYEAFSRRAEEISHMNVAMAQADKTRMAQFTGMQEKVARIADRTTENALNLVKDTAGTLSSATAVVLFLLLRRYF